MTIYRYIIGIEALTDECGKIDLVNAESYEKTIEKYDKDVSNIVKNTGFVVGKEARQLGIDEKFLLNLINGLVNNAFQQSEHFARTDLRSFITLCRGLPRALVAQTTPFEPLNEKFPMEMKVIKGTQAEWDSR